ncbi:MAG: GNAT family N-acetyltransferase [Gammaproteobacteria bacterium]|nr:GNAT family N-acetyltransferase [Gammaproteobacteria bacterium]
MLELQPPYRRAVPGDAKALAELGNMAGDGMPLYIWSGMAEPGQSPWDVGRARAGRETGSFSYRNAVVLEHDEGVAACLIGYPLENDPAPADYSDIPPMFVPLQQLEDMAPGTWYVNVLATYPEQRGKGFGRGLLEVAEAIAADLGKSGLSIIVSDANAGARRLYERQGYIEKAKRPMVKNGWRNRGANWVLLVKNL